MFHYRVGDVGLTRVPYFDVGLDPVSLGLTAALVDSVSWASPTWRQANGQLLVGQAVWVIESARVTMVVDPCGAADAFLRTGPQAIDHQHAVIAALGAAGFPAEHVDTVVLSHLDGIGMTALVNEDGSWGPAFPNARIVITRAELDFLATATGVQGHAVLSQLREQGLVVAAPDRVSLAPDVTLEHTGAHTPGHAVIRVTSGAESALFLGHLAVTPVHVAAGRCPGLHHEPDRAAEVLDQLLREAAGASSLICGPLWPAPGAGHVDGPPWMITPATPAAAP